MGLGVYSRLPVLRYLPLLATFVLACGHPPSPSPSPQRSSQPPRQAAPPAQAVQAPVSVRASPAPLRCPESHEHGCTALFRVPHAGGGAQLVSFVNGKVNDLALSGPELVLAEQISFSTLTAYPKQAGSPAARNQAMRLLDASGSRIRRIASAGLQVAVALEGEVIVTPLDGSPRRLLATTAHAFGIASDGHRVVWSEDGGASRPGRVMIASLDDTQAPVRVVAGAEDAPQDVAIDASGIYWINWGKGYYDPPGQVRALRKGETQAEVFAADQRAPRAITTDAGHVFWVVDGPQGRALRSRVKAAAPGAMAAPGTRANVVVELIAATGREGTRGNEDAIHVMGDQVYFNAGDAVWAVGVEGAQPHRIAAVDANADIVTFVVDMQDIYVVARIYDPNEHEQFDG